MMSFEPGKLRTDGYDDVSGLNTFTSGNGAGKNGCCGNTGSTAFTSSSAILLPSLITASLEPAPRPGRKRRLQSRLH